MSLLLTVDQRLQMFSGDSVTIGSAADCSITFPNDNRVSPHHATIRSVHGRWIIEAVDSGTITVGEGRPVKMGWLNPGDAIKLSESGPQIVFQPVDVQHQLAEIQSTGSGQSSTGSAVQSSRSSDNLSPVKAGSGPAFLQRNAIKIGMMTAGGICLLAIGAWVSRSSQGTAFVAAPEPSEPVETIHTPPPAPAEPVVPVASVPDPVIDPRDFLVLIGIGDLHSQNRPHVLGVGWLWNERVAVVSRPLAEALEGLAKATRDAGRPRQACVIQGVPLAVASIRHPIACKDISLLMLGESAELEIPAKKQWLQVTSRDVERLRAKDRKLTYITFDQLPRSSSMKNDSGLSFVAYDPEVIHPASVEARLIYENQQHILKQSDDNNPLERGGLFIDDKQNIIGMSLLNAGVIWTHTLEPALP